MANDKEYVRDYSTEIQILPIEITKINENENVFLKLRK